MLLDIVEINLFVVLAVVDSELIQKLRNTLIHRHGGQGLLFNLILPLTAANHPCKASVLRRIHLVIYDLINGDRLLHLFRHTAGHLLAVCLVANGISIVHHTNHIFWFLCVLFTHRIPKIGKHFCLSDSNAAPLFVGHIHRLLLRVILVDILTAFHIFFLQSWMGFDCIQVFLYLVHEFG